MADGVGCFWKTHKKVEKSLKKERLRNSKILLGDMKDIPLSVRRIFELALPENVSKCVCFFAPFESTPEEFDKLRIERQTFPQWKVQREFQKLHYRQRIRLKKRKIYISPIGPFPSFVFQNIQGLRTSLFELLSNFISVFYWGFSVEILEVKDLSEISCQTRVHPGTGKLQILVGDVLSYLKEHRPKDGFCIIGISWQDLYPGDEWNFVLGEASSEDGCAALSFGHHEPKPSEKISTLKTVANLRNGNDDIIEEIDEENQNFENNELNLPTNGNMHDSVQKSSGQKNCQDLENNTGRIEKIDAFEIWKFFRVVSHELGHIFGITHCSYFTCAMNESNSIAEAVNQPLFMCPICLRKIHKAVGFDVVDRYSRLKHFLETLHSDLFQEGLKGKCAMNIEHVPGDQRTDIEDFRGRELERISKANDWIDSVLSFLQHE